MAFGRERAPSITETYLSSFLDRPHLPLAKRFFKLHKNNEIPDKLVSNTLNVVLKSLHDQKLSSKPVDEILTSGETSPEATVFSFLHAVASTAIRDNVDEKAIDDDLRALTFPAEMCREIAQKISRSRQKILSQSPAFKSFPSIKDFSWRVDVTISTTQVERVLLPTIIFRVTLTDGTVRTFECSVEQFHKFRYNVASVLSSLNTLDENPVLMQLEEEAHANDA